MNTTALRMPLPASLDKRYGYHVAKRQARIVRRLYAGPLARRLVASVDSPAELSAHLIAFSGERDALEQLVSLRSLIRHVGRPARFTLGSDGSHSRKSIDAFRRVYPELEVIGPSEYMRNDLPASVREYAAGHPLGRKLAFMARVRPEAATIYADSDVLFFPDAAEVREFVAATDGVPRYLLDCARALDDRVVPPDLAAAPPVNSGFWIVHEPLPWDDALALLDSASGGFKFHSEQTVFHVAMHRAGGVPVDPTRYVMQVDDRFDYRTVREHRPIALRHYVSNIRHQFWLNARP